MAKIRLMFSGIPGATERVIRATPVNDTPAAADAAAYQALTEAMAQLDAVATPLAPPAKAPLTPPPAAKPAPKKPAAKKPAAKKSAPTKSGKQ